MLGLVVVPATVYLSLAVAPGLRASRAGAISVVTAYGGPIVAALALLGWLNHVRYGTALSNGYPLAGISAWMPLYVGRR